MNLLTIADGFGDSKATPPWYPDYIKWPDIIKLMTKGLHLTNLSRYGAGNEYMIKCLRANLIDAQAVLVQWAQPDRLDLTLDHSEPWQDFWKEQIASDPVYHSNLIEVDQEKIWISSNSKLDSVREYHKKFITLKQHQKRSQIYIDYAKLLLQNVQHGFLLTKTSEYLSESVTDYSNWYWHKEFCGMCEFRSHSKYAELDLGIRQPIPLIQFDFVRQFIQPRFDLPWRDTEQINAVENMLFRKYKDAVKNRPL